MSDLKSEVMAILIPQIQLIVGPEIEDDVVNLITSTLAPYEFKKSEKSVVVYDKTDSGLIGRYFVAKAALGLSPKTLYFYKSTFEHFFNYVGKHIADITTEDVRLFLTQLKLNGASAVYQNNIRRNLSSLFTFLHEEGLIKINPLTRIKKIRQPIAVKERIRYAVSAKDIQVVCSEPMRNFSMPSTCNYVSFLNITPI